MRVDNRRRQAAVLRRRGPGTPIAILLVAAACAAQAAEWFVATNGLDNGHDGQSWEQAFRTISNALAKAHATIPETILVSNGFHRLEAPLSVTKPVTIRGLGDDGAVPPAVLDGQDRVRCVDLNHADARLEMLTITRGAATNSGASMTSGGGVYLSAGTLSNCWVTHCTATNSGGGVYVYNSGAMTRCVISNNVASRGGGVAFATRSYVPREILQSTVCGNLSLYEGAGGGGGLYLAGPYLVSNCTVRANTAANGGGIDLWSSDDDAPQWVTDCLVEGNIATNRTGVLDRGQGGGLFLFGGASTNSLVSNCRIVRNTACPGNTYHGGGGVSFNAGTLLNCQIVSNSAHLRGQGGGIFVGRNYTKSRVVIGNCLIAGNQASDGNGGGLYHYRNAVDLFSCTVVSNWSSAAGGGVARLGGMSTSYDGYPFLHTVRNNLVAHNDTGVGTSKNLFLGLGSPAFTNNCIDAATDFNQYGTGNFSADPRLLDLAAGDYRLAPSSPCINAGFNEPWMAAARDLDGNLRVDKVTGRPDIGCYEYPFCGTLLKIR